jgi:hypothetical protein
MEVYPPSPFYFAGGYEETGYGGLPVFVKRRVISVEFKKKQGYNFGEATRNCNRRKYQKSKR